MEYKIKNEDKDFLVMFCVLLIFLITLILVVWVCENKEIGDLFLSFVDHYPGLKL